MGKLLDLIGLLDHIHRQRVLGGLIDLRFQVRRQHQQLIRIRHQPLLPI